MHEVLGGAPQAVLGREQGSQPRPSHVAQQIRGVVESRVDRGLVGEKPEAAAAQEAEPMVDEHVEAGLDGRHRARV